ncbi:MAG: hypothetical protein KBD46_03075 [Candidatus Levybacteria bacterium]|nr:hypothetical protein [Candidatus Levybacteria bacterium]
MIEERTFSPDMIAAQQSNGIRQEKIQTAEVIKPAPYVISEDTKILFGRWAEKNNLELPSVEFFNSLREDFDTYMKGIFPVYESVDEKELVSGLKEQITESGLTVVSLDGVYYSSPYRLDMSRHINEEMEPIGHWRRPDSMLLFDQFTLLRDQLQATGVKKIALEDDVVWEGKQISRLIPIIEKRVGVEVPVVYTAIAIGTGAKEVEKLGTKVKSVRYFPEVIDEVCKRDLIVGAPLSGRTVRNSVGVDMGAPYVSPFGNPVDWATIPKEKQKEFSEFCINHSIKLFEAIEKASGREIRCADLSRKVFGLPQDDTRFVDALRQTLAA